MTWEWPEELIFMKNKKAVQKKSLASMEGKLCVISGATSGVGLEAMKRLAKGGAHIVMVSRSKEKAVLVRNDILKEWDVPIEIIVADFSRLEDVRRAASEILSAYRRIDVLINSAGIHNTTKLLTTDGFEQVFCVNHLAPFLFTHLLLDRLKESAPARIIMVNSEGHRFNGLRLDDLTWKKRPYFGLRSYGASKTAQLLTVWEFADILEGTNVSINAMHPGDVKTNIGNNNGWLYRSFLHRIVWPSLKNPAISGEAVYYLAADPEMDHISGRFYNLTIDEKPASHALDRVNGKKVWELSLELTGLNR